MATEAETCRKFVVPQLPAAGWNSDPHSIAEQRYFNANELQFTRPDMLQIPPITQNGNVKVIIGKFGGTD